MAPPPPVSPRERLLMELHQRPGIHLRALQRSVGMDVSTLEHHLRVLEREARVVVRSIGHYKAVYPVAGIDRRDRDILFFLGKPKTHRILLLLATTHTASHARITAVLDVAPATCSFHLKRLRDAGILDSERQGRHLIWSLHDASRVNDLIRRFVVDGALGRPAKRTT